MQDPIAALKAIDLNESEAKIYITSLEIGPSSPQRLVERSGFSRPATYLAIEQLVQKGLMTSTMSGKRQLYSAESPDRLTGYTKTFLQKMEAKAAHITEVVEALKLIQHRDRPQVKLYEGIQGIKAILQDLVDSKPDATEEIVNIDAVKKVFTTAELTAAQNILSKRKTKGRAIFYGEVSEVRSGIEARFLPANSFPFQGDLLLYGTKVAMVTYTDHVMGVVVENKAIADTYHTLFELAWKGCSK
ncbi:hypothetical protein KBC54_04050 [Patescibacteria group bacterium]|nr:hypothetical protein [Patescibacteria group bacterium]